MTNIVCVKHGGFHGPEYVTKLYRALKRNNLEDVSRPQAGVYDIGCYEQ